MSNFIQSNGNDITIQPIQAQQLSTARDIMIKACFELQIVPCDSMANLEDIIQKTNALPDMDDWPVLKKTYFEYKGTFLVMLKDNQVIGMGAIKRVDETTCELKRMFFHHDHRGQGLGSKMLATLIHYAQEMGYEMMRLDVRNPTTQTHAVNLYKKFGFYEVPAYKEDPLAKLFMVKMLIHKL